jgi:ubiquinone/menaquinone biosynthesis C-methylase UbiE
MTARKGPFSDVASFYEAYDEAGRLQIDYFALEQARTRELILRNWPDPPPSGAPKVVLDIGGAAGAYAYWLAELGHQVHLLDPVAKHVRQAREAAAIRAKALASVREGDARALPYADASADVALMLGPLYHLSERADRLLALREAARVLRPGGVLFAAAISRFASLVDGLRTGKVLDDPVFAAIVEDDLRDGRHKNETDNLHYFTSAYFHRPDELRGEVEEAGFEGAHVFAVEGPAFALPDFEARWARPETRETLLRYLRHVDEEPALLGASPHLLVCARTRA